MELKMPKMYESITVKIIGKITRNEIGNEPKNYKFYCPVNIWGDPKKRVFNMELKSTLWLSLDQELTLRYELGGDADEVLDDDLEILIGKIITITGLPDKDRIFITKDGKREPGKKFEVTIREDLEDIDKRGESKEYISAVQRETDNNMCVKSNLEKADIEQRKQIAKEKKIEKREEIVNKDKNIKTLYNWLSDIV